MHLSLAFHDQTHLRDLIQKKTSRALPFTREILFMKTYSCPLFYSYCLYLEIKYLLEI